MAWKFLFGLYWLSIIHSVALILPVSAVSGSENQCPGAVSREEFDELRADLRKLVELVAEIKSGQGSNSARQPVSTDEARSRAKRDVGAANTLTEELAQLKAEFQEFKEDVAPKLNIVLSYLAKDGYLAELLSGPPGEKGERGERGPVGPPGKPGPQANIAPLVGRLEEVERIISDAPEEIGFKIFLSTDRGGVHVYSPLTQDVRKIVDTTENIEGIAFDSKERKLYYSTDGSIYTSTPRGTNVQTVFTDSERSPITGLAYDWITGNVYGASYWTGSIFVCKAALSGPLSCTTVLTGKGNIRGIVLNPNKGTMYWTTHSPGSLWKSQMDGTDANEMVINIAGPNGLVVDNLSSKVFFTEGDMNKIWSISLEGRGLSTVHSLSDGAYPYGMTLYKEILYFTTFNNKTVYTMNQSGGDVRILGTLTHSIRHLALAARNPPQTRPNHCSGNSCSNICVLTANSARCLPA